MRRRAGDDEAAAEKGPTVHMSRPVEQPGVRLLRIEASETPFQAFQETWDICIIAEGAADWRYRGHERTSTTGNIRLKEPGERFRTAQVHVPTAYVIVQVEPRALGHYLRDEGGPHLRMNEIEGTEAFAIARLVRRAHGCDTALERGTVLAALLEAALLPRLERHPRRHGSGVAPGALRRAYDFLHAHFAEEVSIATLASLAGMHEVSFVRAFRRAFGIPPHRLQTELRIRSAKRLLDLGAPGAEVAARLGFHDQSHLSRHFKNIVGLSPGRYLATRH